jgi:hypothetical protein
MYCALVPLRKVTSVEVTPKAYSALLSTTINIMGQRIDALLIGFPIRNIRHAIAPVLRMKQQ